MEPAAPNIYALSEERQRSKVAIPVVNLEIEGYLAVRTGVIFILNWMPISKVHYIELR